MARYEVTGVRVEPCPADGKRRHITEAELVGSKGTQRAATSVVRLMLSADNDIVTMSHKTGSEADVRKGRCACGIKSIRSVHGSRTDDDMGTLPTYS